MLHSVIPWTATVKSDLDSRESLLEVSLAAYELQFYNTADSLWLIVKRPSAGSIAFRLAFGMNSIFDNVAITELEAGMLITASTRLGNYRITVTFPSPAKLCFVILLPSKLPFLC